MHCLVTGAAGFVGSTLVERLLELGHTVVGLDCFIDYYPKAVKLSNIEKARSNSRYTFVEDNLVTCDLPRICDGVQWIFHQAGQAGVRASWGSYFDTYTLNNITATQRLLEYVKGSKKVERVVYASSSSVYGNAETLPTTEDMRPQPVSPYGVTKLAAEHLMSLYASEFNVPTVSLRYFTVFGPRQRPDMGFHRFIRAALQKEEIVLYGDGTQSRDFTFVRDIVDANILAAEKGAKGGVYNIGGGCRATVLEVFEIIESYVGKMKIRREDRQKGDALHTGASTDRARRELGYAPQFSLKEGIRLEVDWLRDQIARA